MDGWMDGWIDWLIDWWMDGWMDGWMDMDWLIDWLILIEAYKGLTVSVAVWYMVIDWWLTLFGCRWMAISATTWQYEWGQTLRVDLASTSKYDIVVYNLSHWDVKTCDLIAVVLWRETSDWWVGPTVFRGPRNFEPSHGICPMLRNCNMAAEFERWPEISMIVGVMSDLAAKEQQPDDDFVFWRTVEDRLPTLTALEKAYITSVDVGVECSFSKNGPVLSLLQRTLSTDSLKAYCSIFNNQAVNWVNLIQKRCFQRQIVGLYLHQNTLVVQLKHFGSEWHHSSVTHFSRLTSSVSFIILLKRENDLSACDCV